MQSVRNLPSNASAAGGPLAPVRTRDRLAARRFMLIQNRVHALWGPLYTETVATVEQRIYNCAASRDEYVAAVQHSDALIASQLDTRLRWQFGRQGLKAKI